MTIEIKPLAEITEEGIRALCRALGAADALRFINQFYKGSGDYTREREEFFKNQNLDQLVREIKEKRGSDA